MQHLPFLLDLAEEFEVAVVCDVSPSLAAHAADRFHVPRHVNDYRDVLSADVDAVLLCHADPKMETAVAALDAGKHLFIEKPMCFSMEEADEIVAAADRSGQIALVGVREAVRACLPGGAGRGCGPWTTCVSCR